MASGTPIVFWKIDRWLTYSPRRISHMTRYLIEVPHDPDTHACARVVQIFLATGSHLLSNADWGCLAGVHSGWLIVETSSEKEARNLVPPALRTAAKITGLNKFTLEDVNSILSHHLA
jgi:hypothetical protein